MTPHAVDTVLALVLTGLLTLQSALNRHAVGWRGWVPAVGMLAAFTPLLRAESPPLTAHPALLVGALALWVAVLVLRPQQLRALRRLAIGACGFCVALLELS